MRLLSRLGDLCLRTGQCRVACAGLILLAGLGCLPCEGGDGGPSGKRRITVKDTIEMTEFADRGYFLGGEPASPVAIFSPSGKQFLIRLKKGNVARNVVEYSLLLVSDQRGLPISRWACAADHVVLFKSRGNSGGSMA